MEVHPFMAEAVAINSSPSVPNVAMVRIAMTNFSFFSEFSEVPFNCCLSWLRLDNHATGHCLAYTNVQRFNQLIVLVFHLWPIATGSEIVTFFFKVRVMRIRGIGAKVIKSVHYSLYIYPVYTY